MFGRKENKDETSKSQLSVGVSTAETLEERNLENREMEDTGVALLRREDMQRSPATGGSTGALLGRGCRFEGKLTFEGTVQIDGEFFGDIDSPSSCHQRRRSHRRHRQCCLSGHQRRSEWQAYNLRCA